MYVEICPWVILFNPKLENEVLNDIQTCRFEKHGFFKFRGWSPRYWQLWGLHFGLQSLKNVTIINFRKKWKFLLFIIFAQNAPVLTCNPNEWNGIRFLTMIKELEPTNVIILYPVRKSQGPNQRRASKMMQNSKKFDFFHFRKTARYTSRWVQIAS